MRRALEDFKARFSPTQRLAIILLGAAEFGLKVAAVRDMHRRSVEQVRGSKLLWHLALLINTFGPVSYFCWGRRKASST